MDQLEKITDSFDAFLKEDQEQIDKKHDALALRFKLEREEWSGKIKEMSGRLKNVMEVYLLQVDVYTERQRAVEYYHYILSLLSKMGIDYNKQYVARYDFYLTQSNVRYPNETSRVNKVMSELSDLVYKREQLQIHAKFILGTIASIDGIIYGIKYRIDLQNISNGK